MLTHQTLLKFRLDWHKFDYKIHFASKSCISRRLCIRFDFFDQNAQSAQMIVSKTTVVYVSCVPQVGTLRRTAKRV